MQRSTDLGLKVGAAALVLGALADWLLRAPPGLGWSLWLLGLAVVSAMVWRRSELVAAGAGRWAWVPALVFALALSWRNAPALQALNLLAILLALALVAGCTRRGALWPATVSDYVLALALAAWHLVAGPLLLLFVDLRWSDLPRGRRVQSAAALVRGLVLAVPLLLVFGLLFMAADVMFANLITALVNATLQRSLEHLVMFAFGAWLAAAFLRALLLGRSPDEVPVARPAISLGIVEVSTALGLVTVLFLAFVAVQVRYLFGGAEQVLTSATLTYAEYARSGFFELVTVTALVLPLLLTCDWLVLGAPTPHRRRFQLLASGLLFLLAVIMASAVQRLRIYQAQFGLTESRLYAMMFMVWLTTVFVWFAITVLRDRRERFATGAVVTGLATLAALNLLSPDAMVVRSNLSRHSAGRPFDAHYAATRSGDAVPTLVAGLFSLPAADRQATAAQLLLRWGPERTAAGWQAWNWGRSQALATVAAHAQQLRAYADTPR